jgi:tRNA1Val (adenine37-N6)-methyltransferase
VDSTTQDFFFDGRLCLKQPLKGYRYSIDSVILASALHPKAGDAVVDLGTGCGIIPLILAFRRSGIRIWGVELQEELAAVAEANVRENGMASRVTVFCADMRHLRPERFGAPVDMVVSNPPYRQGRSGRVNPDTQRALARHEIAITLLDLVRVGRRLLKTGGRFVTIYAAHRMAELISCMRAERIEPKRLRSIHSSHGQDAHWVLVEGRCGGKTGIAITPPLVVYGEDGNYTEEAQAMFRV